MIELKDIYKVFSTDEIETYALNGINADVIRAKTRENNPVYDDFKIRLTEAEANVVKAKRERMPDVNLYLSIGATGSDRSFAGSYTNLMNRQIAEIGISIPILDWGKRKGNYVQAKSDYELTKVRIEREEDQFDEKVRILAEISVTDLNYAEQEKDRARKNYISQLYLSWLYYYNLRYITLYDFAAGCDIYTGE